MNPGEDTVTMTKKEYESLLDDRNWRNAVEGAGVDNWSGFDYAMEDYNRGED